MAIVVKNDELKERKSRMRAVYQELEQELIECVKKVDESKEVFDTPTATYFREKVSEYIYQGMHKFEANVNLLETTLDQMIKIYESLENKLETSVGGDK